MVNLEYQEVHTVYLGTITFNEGYASAKLPSNISPHMSLHMCACLLIECPCAVDLTPRRRRYPVACNCLELSSVC